MAQSAPRGAVGHRMGGEVMTITAEVAAALIGLAGSAFGSVLGVIASGSLTRYRLEQLEKRVEAHNNLVARTYKLEQQEAVLEERLDVANHRIEGLEKEQSK